MEEERAAEEASNAMKERIEARKKELAQRKKEEEEAQMAKVQSFHSCCSPFLYVVHGGGSCR